MSEEYGDENAKEAREMTSLERASRGRVGGGGVFTGGLRSNVPGRIEKTPGEPEGPFRLWQRAFNDELGALQKEIEVLEGQLTPYLMPQTEADALSKEATPNPPQSELVAWMESSAMVVKLARAHVSRLTQRLEL